MSNVQNHSSKLGGKMRKLSILIVTFSLILTSFITTSAKGFKHNFDKRGKIIKQLNLTDKQLEKFNNIRLNQEEVKIEIESKLKKNKLALKRLLLNDDFTKQEILQLTDNASKLHAELKKSKTETWFDIYNILDDNQKQVWKNHFTAMLEHGNKNFRKPGNKRMGMNDKPYFNNSQRFRNNN